jgi:hypothetical protein
MKNADPDPATGKIMPKAESQGSLLRKKKDIERRIPMVQSAKYAEDRQNRV